MAKDLYTIQLTKHTGYLVMWSNERRSFSGTSAQLHAAYDRTRRHNLLLGWWSPASPLVNSYVLFINRRTLKKLEELVRSDFGTSVK